MPFLHSSSTSLSQAWRTTKNKTNQAWQTTKSKTNQAWQTTKSKTNQGWQKSKSSGNRLQKGLGSAANTFANDTTQSLKKLQDQFQHQEHLRKLRDSLEDESNVSWPNVTAGRAICYASLIYQWATHGVKMNFDWVEKTLHARFGKEPGMAEDLLEDRVEETYRSWGVQNVIQLTDKSPGLAMIKVEPPVGDWRHIYVVFRGSRGDKEGSANPQGSGWDEDNNVKYNVDWRANFDSCQTAFNLTAVASHVQVHQGFLYLYASMARTVKSILNDIDLSDQSRNTTIVVTGHSLGAALATLCAYHLSYEFPQLDTVLMAFCSPRVGNEHFAKDFNKRLADKSISTLGPDTGAYRCAYRFDQLSDLVSWGCEHAFKPVALSDSLPEKSVAKKGLQGAWREINTFIPSQPYYHVQNKITVSKLGMHSYVYMLDQLLGSSWFDTTEKVKNSPSWDNDMNGQPIFVHRS